MLPDVLAKVSPIFLTFTIGYLLKRFKIVRAEDGGLLLTLAFFVATPALIFSSVSSLKLSIEFLFFPLLALAVILGVFGFSFLISRRLNYPRPTIGTFLISTMVNTSFVLPFIQVFYGSEGIARQAAFDFAALILLIALIYPTSVLYGRRKVGIDFVYKVLAAPPLWALLLGLVFNSYKLVLPAFLETAVKGLGSMTSPLILLALGMYFNVKVANLRLGMLALNIRFVGGFIAGGFFCLLLGLSGLDRGVALALAAAPVSFNTITFSNLEKLDVKFAASLVSLGILIGMIVTPLILIFN